MPKCLIIIPCYNEFNRIPIDQYKAYLDSEESRKFDLLFVDDGSTDGTIDHLKGISELFPNCSYKQLEKNVGKAEAIRSAIMEVKVKDHDYIGYYDADLATPLSELERLRNVAKAKSAAQLIIGSRIKILGMTDIRRKLSRHYLGRVFATVVSNMLDLPIYDTQCGAKLIKTEKAIEIFKEPFISKWLFDVELIFRLKKSSSDCVSKIIEVPLRRWEDVSGSKFKFLDFLTAPLELMKIYIHYR